MIMMMMMMMTMMTNTIPYRRTKTHIWDKVLMGIWVHPVIITIVIITVIIVIFVIVIFIIITTIVVIRVVIKIDVIIAVIVKATFYEILVTCKASFQPLITSLHAAPGSAFHRCG